MINFTLRPQRDNLMDMVKLRIREVAESRGIKTAYGLQKALSAPPAMAARLWRGEMSMIGLGTIDALCEALACEPGDLLVREKATKVSARKAKAGDRGKHGDS